MQELDAIRLEVLLAVCYFERDFPRAELNFCMHAIIHLADQIKMYGPLRDTWMFAFESYNGKLTRDAGVI